MKFEKVSFKQFKNDYITTYLPGVKEVTPMMEDVIRRIYNAIKLPKRATAGSAGYDFYLPTKAQFTYKKEVLIPTGIKCQLDPDKVLMMYPRSGLGFKHLTRLNNTVAVIDADFYNNPKNEGHIFIKMRLEKKGDAVELNAGDAFVQGIIMQYFTTEDDNSTAERTGGLGSTGV